ncbi:hypothetical protein [Fructilactobacillus frigidiflavus]|uniref:hypothetical protein n=1 Tax=Fructilactobacillus frigidiflavus TaxID=3242688 RepID=UPI0037584C6E
MKKFWYFMWLIIFIVVLWSGYLFVTQATSQKVKIMGLFIGLVILARIVITPIVTILIQRHDRLKEQKEQEREKHGK